MCIHKVSYSVKIKASGLKSAIINTSIPSRLNKLHNRERSWLYDDDDYSTYPVNEYHSPFTLSRLRLIIKRLKFVWLSYPLRCRGSTWRIICKIKTHSILHMNSPTTTHNCHLITLNNSFKKPFVLKKGKRKNQAADKEFRQHWKKLETENCICFSKRISYKWQEKDVKKKCSGRRCSSQENSARKEEEEEQDEELKSVADRKRENKIQYRNPQNKLIE